MLSLSIDILLLISSIQLPIHVTVLPKHQWVHLLYSLYFLCCVNKAFWFLQHCLIIHIFSGLYSSPNTSIPIAFYKDTDLIRNFFFDFSAQILNSVGNKQHPCLTPLPLYSYRAISYTHLDVYKRQELNVGKSTVNGGTETENRLRLSAL